MAEAYDHDGAVRNLDLLVSSATIGQDGLKLYQNKPNPFTGETIIGFELMEASATTLTILDMSGKVLRVIKGEHPKGYNQLVIDGKTLDEQGVFYYQLATDSGVETKKMILLKQ